MSRKNQIMMVYFRFIFIIFKEFISNLVASLIPAMIMTLLFQVTLRLHWNKSWLIFKNKFKVGLYKSLEYAKQQLHKKVVLFEEVLDQLPTPYITDKASDDYLDLDVWLTTDFFLCNNRGGYG